jgi:hypothetical protein
MSPLGDKKLSSGALLFVCWYYSTYVGAYQWILQKNVWENAFISRLKSRIWSILSQNLSRLLQCSDTSFHRVIYNFFRFSFFRRVQVTKNYLVSLLRLPVVRADLMIEVEMILPRRCYSYKWCGTVESSLRIVTLNGRCDYLQVMWHRWIVPPNCNFKWRTRPRGDWGRAWWPDVFAEKSPKVLPNLYFVKFKTGAV